MCYQTETSVIRQTDGQTERFTIRQSDVLSDREMRQQTDRRTHREMTHRRRKWFTWVNAGTLRRSVAVETLSACREDRGSNKRAS
jgi:hypothetical protein